MSSYTQLNPARRIERLRTFNQRLQTTAESVKVLTDWNMQLDENLVELQGRKIVPQKIVFNPGCRYVIIRLIATIITFYWRFV